MTSKVKVAVKKTAVPVNNLTKYTNKYLKILGNNASLVSNGTIYDTVGYYDTGCYMLNAQLCGTIYGGIATNRIIGLAGEEQTGKSYLLLSIVKNFLDSVPNGLVMFFESEGAINKEGFEKRGIDTTRVIFVPVESVEHFREEATKFVKDYVVDPVEERPKIFMCLDSLGMLPSVKEVTDAEEGNDKSDMTRPKIIKSIFRILTVRLAMANIAMVVTNHVYATMDKYTGNAMGGGSGLKYAGSTIVYLNALEYATKDKDTKKKEHFGIMVKCTTVKSRATRTKKQIYFPIHVEYGVDKFAAMFEFCLEVGLITVPSLGYYQWKGEGDKLRKSDILNNLPTFFDKEKLTSVDEACQKHFLYGQGERPMVDPLDDDNADDSDDMIIVKDEAEPAL